MNPMVVEIFMPVTVAVVPGPVDERAKTSRGPAAPHGVAQRHAVYLPLPGLQ